MSVPLPSRYGLIVRKTSVPATSAASRALCAKHIEAQDSDLWAFTVASNPQEALAVCAELLTAGLVRGDDFVLTQAGKGVVGDLPAWLVEALGSTGNPPDLEARMSPEVRAMWDAARTRDYRLVKDEAAPT